MTIRATDVRDQVIEAQLEAQKKGADAAGNLLQLLCDSLQSEQDRLALYEDAISKINAALRSTRDHDRVASNIGRELVILGDGLKSIK